MATLLLAVSVAQAQITLKSPSWNALTPQEQQILAPLAPDWNKLDAAAQAEMAGHRAALPEDATRSAAADPGRRCVPGPS